MSTIESNKKPFYDFTKEFPDGNYTAEEVAKAMDEYENVKFRDALF